MVKFAEDDTNYKGIMGYLYELCKTDEGLDWGEEGVFDASESDEDISPPQESLGSEEDESQAWTLAAGTYGRGAPKYFCALAQNYQNHGYMQQSTRFMILA